MTLLQGTPAKPKPDYNNLYWNAVGRKITEYAIATAKAPEDDSKSIVKQIVFYGVRYFNTLPPEKVKSEGYTIANLNFMKLIFALIGQLTPRELTTIFPIAKRYDGERREIKDYFYTIECLNGIGMDAPIGDRALDVVWDYTNMEITQFGVKLMGAYDDVRRLGGECGMAEEWLATQGVFPIGTMHTNEVTGKRYLLDRNGKAKPFRKKKPRYLKILN